MAELGTADVARAEDAEPIGFFFLCANPDISARLDNRWSRFKTPWPIQTFTLPIIQEGVDVVVRALPGSGKTFTYLVHILESFRSDFSRGAPLAIIVLPTFELCKKVHKQLMELAELCEIELKVSLVESESENLIENSDIVISTPSGVLSCLEHGLIQLEFPYLKYTSARISLCFLVLDEVDFLFLPGFEDGLTSVKSIVDRIPESSQCLVFSADPSADVKKLKGLVLHNPYVLTLTEDKYCKAEISPYNFRHFYVPCKEDEKPVYLPEFLKITIGRVVIFTNSDENSSWLNSLIQKEFNKEDSDILIVTDNNQSASMQPIGMKKKSESLNCDSGWVVFEDVMVVHYDMPRDGDGYIRRILSTKTPADMIGYSISMATSLDKDVFKQIKSSLGEDGNLNTKFVVQIPWYGCSLGDVDDECPRFSVQHVLYDH